MDVSSFEKGAFNRDGKPVPYNKCASIYRINICQS